MPMFQLMFFQIITDYKCVIFRCQHSYFDSSGRQVLLQAIERGAQDGGGCGVGGTDTQGGLHGEGGDACGAEERVGGEDHQVGGDSCSGGRIEAGDGEDGLHGRRGGKRAKNCIFEKMSNFRQTGRKQSASKISAPKMLTLGQFHELRPRISYITEGVVRQVLTPNKRLQMIDLSCSVNDNNRWSVPMKRIFFRTASTGTARRFGAGVLLMGLALSASAKDGSLSGTAPPAPAVKAKPSAM